MSLAPIGGGRRHFGQHQQAVFKRSIPKPTVTKPPSVTDDNDAFAVLQRKLRV